jgi:hypothetical protein
MQIIKKIRSLLIKVCTWYLNTQGILDIDLDNRVMFNKNIYHIIKIESKVSLYEEDYIKITCKEEKSWR